MRRTCYGRDMRTTDPFPEADGRTTPHGLTYSAARVLAGNCPECHRALVVFNDGESWPLVACTCGWRGAVGEFPHVQVNSDRYQPIDVSGYFPDGKRVRYTHRTGPDVHTIEDVDAIAVSDPTRYERAQLTVQP